VAFAKEPFPAIEHPLAQKHGGKIYAPWLQLGIFNDFTLKPAEMS